MRREKARGSCAPSLPRICLQSKPPENRQRSAALQMHSMPPTTAPRPLVTLCSSIFRNTSATRSLILIKNARFAVDEADPSTAQHSASLLSTGLDHERGRLAPRERRTLRHADELLRVAASICFKNRIGWPCVLQRLRPLCHRRRAIKIMPIEYYWPRRTTIPGGLDCKCRPANA